MHKGLWRRTQQGEEVRGALRWLITATERHTCISYVRTRPNPDFSLLGTTQDSPPPPRRVEMPMVGGTAAAFACRSAALQLSVSRRFRMNAPVPSSTRRNYLPAICEAFCNPPNLILNSVISSSRHTIHQPFPCPPE